LQYLLRAVIEMQIISRYRSLALADI